LKNEEVERMSESKGEGGSWLYGILLILAGGFIVVTGIMNLVGYNPLLPLVPEEYWPFLSVTSYLYIALGAWGVIGGIGLIKDQEWGWGISLVVLSVVIVAFVSEVIAGFMTANWTNIIFWIKFAALVVAAVGIVYLLLTKYKYA